MNSAFLCSVFLAIGVVTAADAPLKGRLVTLTAEVAGLEARIGVLKTQVGGLGGAAAETPAALMETSKLLAAYKALLHSKGDDLSSTVTELETKMHTVESD